MGTEYYLVKPEKREIFYLGKHMSCPDGIINGSYSDSLKDHVINLKPINYDCWEDFFWDFLRENSYCFENITLEQSKEIIYNIYEWCLDGCIYFDHDCHMNKVEWLEWKETGSLIDLFEKINDREKV